MKKIFILLLTAIFCLTESKAQTNAKIRDSLKVLLQKERQDTSTVGLLNQLGRTYTNNNPDTAMIVALEALSLSKRIGFVRGEARSLIIIGQIYRNLGNFPKAMEVHLQALKLDEKINNLTGIGTDLNAIGGNYDEQGEYDQAIQYFLKSKKLNEQLNNKKGLAGSLSNLGRSYFHLKQYDSARVFVQQAYEIAVNINDSFRKGLCLSLMGRIYSETGQYKLALEYYRLSLTFDKVSEGYTRLSGTFLGMAKLFEKEGQLDSTLFYAKQAFEINKSIGKPTREVSEASSYLSSFYKKKGNVDSAFFYIEISKAANDSIYNKEKINQFQSLSFDEKFRQQEIALAELKDKEARNHNLQFSAIAIGLITFIILFFVLSRSIIVNTKFIEFFGVLLLLAVFEFINLLIHPYLAHVTSDSPILMLAVLIAIGALLIPLHHKLEKWITKIMVEKNKKIRLDAAKKTIAVLEAN